MTIGKIQINLLKLKYNVLFEEKRQVVKNYLDNYDYDINNLIEIISDGELTLYTEEDFSFDYIYKFSNFLPITIEEFEEFKRRKVFDADSTDIDNYYANFHYVDGKYIDSKTDKDIFEGDAIPCLIHLNEHIMTYYIFDWYAYDNHNFEIED